MLTRYKHGFRRRVYLFVHQNSVGRKRFRWNVVRTKWSFAQNIVIRAINTKIYAVKNGKSNTRVYNIVFFMMKYVRGTMRIRKQIVRVQTLFDEWCVVELDVCEKQNGNHAYNPIVDVRYDLDRFKNECVYIYNGLIKKVGYFLFFWFIALFIFVWDLFPEILQPKDQNKRIPFSRELNLSLPVCHHRKLCGGPLIISS